MQLRVADQVEAERRAALSAGRRRIERQLAAQLADEQAAARTAHQVRIQLHAVQEAGTAADCGRWRCGITV